MRKNPCPTNHCQHLLSAAWAAAWGDTCKFTRQDFAMAGIHLSHLSCRQYLKLTAKFPTKIWLGCGCTLVTPDCQLGHWVPAEKPGFELNATFVLVTQLTMQHLPPTTMVVPAPPCPGFLSTDVQAGTETGQRPADRYFSSPQAKENMCKQDGKALGFGMPTGRNKTCLIEHRLWKMLWMQRVQG